MILCARTPAPGAGQAKSTRVAGLDLPRFGGRLRAWDQGIWSDGILLSCLVSFFCSAPGGAISSWPARWCGRRAQRRSRTAPVGGRPKGLSLTDASTSGAQQGVET
jgi:hypothetical protein